MRDDMVKVVQDRCRVALAAILNYKDREVDVHLPEHVRAELRTTVLREVNLFAEFVLDVLNTVQADRLVLNGQWLDQISRKLDDVYDAIVPAEANG